MRSCWSRMSVLGGGRGAGAVSAGGRVRGMTAARAGAGGGRWTWGCSGRSWRRTRPGCPVPSTGSWSRMCHGRATTRDTPCPSTTRSRGWRPGPRSRRWSSCCESRGARSGRSSPGSWPRAVQRDPLAGLARIGIDEISYKRGHRYITLVVDHDSGRLVWAAPGRDRKTLAKFFAALGETRCAAITHVSADAATWIADEVADKCPNAVRCADPFHIVAVRHEAPCVSSGGERPPPPGCRSSPAKLGAA